MMSFLQNLPNSGCGIFLGLAFDANDDLLAIRLELRESCRISLAPLVGVSFKGTPTASSE